MSRPPLFAFDISSKEGDNLPNARTKEGFDPNVYKFMENTGYECKKPAT